MLRNLGTRHKALHPSEGRPLPGQSPTHTSLDLLLGPAPSSPGGSPEAGAPGKWCVPQPALPTTSPRPPHHTPLLPTELCSHAHPQVSVAGCSQGPTQPAETELHEMDG